MADEPRPHYFSTDPPLEAPPARALPGWLVPAIGVAFALLVGFVAYRGCAIEPAPSVEQARDVDRATADPWPSVLTDLRRQSDVAGSRSTLDRLTTALAFNKSPGLRPDALDPAAAAELQNTLGLSDAEAGEIRPATYTALDAHYLAECYYLRDCARSLDAAQRPPLEQATLAFEFVGRQVADRLWVQPDGRGNAAVMPQIPPAAVLSRGSGGAFERAVTFLALCRQFGLDGCLVGGPGREPQPWNYAAARGAPLWGVGVRVGADIILFDPVRMLPVPGPGGKPATLAQLKADPGLVKPWRAEGTAPAPWAVPDADIKAAVAYPYVELSALAPRMQRLERELRADAPPVRLYQDWPALLKRFAAPGRAVAAWASPDPSAPVRLLASFVPPREGGYAPDPDLGAKLQASQIPGELVSPDSPVAGVERLRQAVLVRYVVAFVQPPSPKERVARGEFTEVVRDLVERLREYEAAQDRSRADRDPAAVQAFLDELADIGRQKRLARDKEGGEPGPLTAEAAEREARLFKARGAAADKLVYQALGRAGAAEATFLIALAMHEQAERAQARADRGVKGADAAAKRAWAEAAGWWARYAPYQATQSQNFPGRGTLADRLRARAARGG